MSTITVSDTASLNAALKNVQSGDTVLLRSGTYSGVRLQQKDVPGNVTVTSADPAHQAVITDLTVRHASGFTFTGLTVLVNEKSPEVGAIGVFDSSNIVLDKLYVHGSLDNNPLNDGIGVHIQESTNVKVTNSEFEELMIGVRHSDAEQLTVSRNYIHDMRMDAIRGGGSSNVTIQYNYITEFHRAEGDHSDGVQFYPGVKNVVVHDINVSNNVMEQGAGTDFQGVFMRTTDGEFQRVSITNNFIAGGAYNGIFVENGDNVRIADNQVITLNSNQSWISFKSTEAATLTGNVAVNYLIDAGSQVTQSNNRTSVTAGDHGISALNDWLSHNSAARALLPTGFQPATGASALGLVGVGLGAGLGLSSGAALMAAEPDVVTAAVSTTLSQRIHDLTLTGTAVIDGAGNALDNHLIGNAGANKLYGFEGNDVIEGGDGDDVIDGGAGNDTASYEHARSAVTVSLDYSNRANGVVVNTGGAGNDKLIFIENLVGSAFDDKLTGNALDNVLTGGAGSDKLVGGAGADILLGGAGADSFYFMNSGDSTVAQSGRDKIMDFSHADGDVIDLYKVDANTATSALDKFTLVSNFTNKAGQLTVNYASDHYVVQGDTNGDGIADFAIDVYSRTALVASDFIF